MNALLTFPASRTTASLVTILLAAMAAQAGILVSVPGTSNPYLAGAPNATAANISDAAPAQSPVLAATGLPAGGWVEFSNASGTVSNSPWADKHTAGPEGDASFVIDHHVGPENGIANIKAPFDALLGVFLDASVPADPGPSMLTFDTQAARDYLTLSPQLCQTFFIGDGLTSGAVQQKVFIPAGATRLFLGVMDGEDWNNNLGSFCVNVNVVPEPATLGLLALGALALVRARRRR